MNDSTLAARLAGNWVFLLVRGWRIGFMGIRRGEIGERFILGINLVFHEAMCSSCSWAGSRAIRFRSARKTATIPSMGDDTTR